MLKHRHTDKICAAIVAAAVLAAALFCGAASLGLLDAVSALGYEARLFDTSRVHTIDIVMDDWDGFIETCENEEYSSCSVVIDGEAFRNVGIRAKGNTSLSSVAAYGNDRYSFKIEFDKYTDQSTYYGLDKLSLNNLIQDNTYLKDYLSYAMMRAAGAPSPLASFVYITVNGEDWGLYLAVEGVEESFLERNYGADYGNLYKPDSMNFGGGGPGNGKGFDMDQFMENAGQQDTAAQDGSADQPPELPDGFDPAAEGARPPEPPADIQTEDGAQPPDGSAPGGDGQSAQNAPTPPDGQQSGGGRGGMGGMGSSDVKLQYIDDDPDSYSNIFDNAKTEITTADKTRLINSLKTLSEGDDPASVVDTDAVIRYFVAHTFVRNDDSYTGSMIHNYYLYEEDGVLSMIPWDYNLAFGGFGMGGGRGGQSSGTSTGATSDVNYPIDSPVSGGDISSRPMIAWIFDSEEYTELYHQYYREFIDSYFTSGAFEEEFDRVVALISPYVEKDPTAFCTYEQFQTGAETLREFCLLRAQSVLGQLDGSIPSTSEGQAADSSALVDASHLSLSDMGSMGMGGGFGGGPDGGGRMGMGRADAAAVASAAAEGSAEADGTSTAQPGTDATASPANQGAAGTGGRGGRNTGGLPAGANGSAASAQGDPSAAAPPSDGSASAPASTASPDANASAGAGQPDGSAEAAQGEGSFPQDAGGGRQMQPPDMAGGWQEAGAAASGSSAANTLLWVGICALVLAAGIVIAVKVKH